MSLIKKNIAANFAGSVWQAVVNLAFVPLYIKLLGMESWGLIGFFVTLQAIFGLLDIGLSSTLNREMARLSVLPGKEQEMRNLVRTLEVVYWCVAAFVGIAIAALSPVIAHYWIKAGQLAPKTIEQACLIMGFVIALQMLAGFYSGGMMGLQKQVFLNVVSIVINTLRGAGAALILWLVSPTIQAFFLWQIIISMVNAFLLAVFLWRGLPPSKNNAVFQKQLLKGIWRFTAGMSGITVLGTILTQMDKIILSKMLSLEMFGYYMLASVIGMSLYRFFTPVFYSIYPRFTQLVCLEDQDGLTQFYHKSCQFMSVLVMPIAVVIALFSYEIILLWTQNPATAGKTSLILSIMICGSAFSGLTNPPYALQLAFGWTSLPVYANLIAVVLFVPLIISMVAWFGAIGGAGAWLILNVGFVVFWIPAMHKKLLLKEKWRWCLQDVGIPAVACISIAGLCRLFIREPMTQYMLLLSLIIISVLTLGITALATPVTRAWLLNGRYLQKIYDFLFFNIRQNQIIKRGKKIIKKVSVDFEYKVLNGVFKGLQYPSLNITEAALVPKIVGSYEYQLQPWFSHIINTGYLDIIDIGSAEGYYAVGLAKKMPNAIIHCYDINKKDIEFSKEMAKVNGVSNLTWNTFCNENTLLDFAYRGKTLVICDCEGYELELFTKSVIDKCRHVDFLIELHDVINPVISGQILAGFRFTHACNVVNNKDVDYGRLNGLKKLSPDERAFALCEHRGGLYKNIVMEWAFLTSKESQ